MSQFLELFRRLSRPATRTVLGLWGELFLIAGASRPADLLAAWHALATERYDFSAGPQRIDVKAASGPVRRHDFSLAQLAPPPGAEAVIASILVDPSAGGISVSDLVARIQRVPGVSPDALVALQLQVADALGADWPDAATQRYDAHQAAATLSFYAASDIPTVPLPPPQVTNVRFTADISDVRPMPLDDMRAGGHLFAAAVPSASPRANG